MDDELSQNQWAIIDDQGHSHVLVLAAPDVNYSVGIGTFPDLAIHDEVVFFKVIDAALHKQPNTVEGAKTRDEIEPAIRQLVSRAIASDQVIEIVAAGQKKPDISSSASFVSTATRWTSRRRLLRPCSSRQSCLAWSGRRSATIPLVLKIPLNCKGVGKV